MLQLAPMNLCPGLDQPILRLRQGPAKAFEGVHREDRGVLLIVRVEMCSVVPRAAKLRARAPRAANSSFLNWPRSTRNTRT